MSKDKEFSTVRVACEVSFTVGHMNYGTITVPVGTKVFRHRVNGKVSDWFVADADLAKLCPDSYKINGEPSDFYMHDASHYGISMPNANVAPVKGPYIIGHGGENAQTFHKAHHY